jgi:hypothetical protein
MHNFSNRDISKKFKVLKFHGDYTDEDSLVLTSDSFKANYGITSNINSMDITVNFRSNRVCEILRKIVGNHTILFLGCSLNEDLFINFFTMLSRYSVYKHYAILPKPKDDEKLQKLKTQALLMNTSVIWIEEDKFDWVDTIIDHVFSFTSIATGTRSAAINMNILSESKDSTSKADDKFNADLKKVLDTIYTKENDNNEVISKEELTRRFIENRFHRKICVIPTEDHTKFAITFPMYKLDGGLYNILLIKEDGKFYLSDGGSTYAELEKIFEMKEPDVIKNLIAVLKQYGCRKSGTSNSFMIECSPQDIHIKLSYLIQTLSFMLNMKIFYV